MTFCKKLTLIFFLALIPNVSWSSPCQKSTDTSTQSLQRPSIETGYHAKTKSQIIINKSPNEVTAWFDNVPPEKIIHSTDKVSGISGTKIIGNKAWGTLNSTRLICYEDNNTSLEQILKNSHGKIFKYQMWDFTKDFTHSIKYAISEFNVKPIGENQSILEWNFSFRPNNYISRLPLKHYLENDFQEYMENGLGNIKSYLEL